MPHIEKFRSAGDGRWHVVTVPDAWTPQPRSPVDALPLATGESSFLTEEEADAERRRRVQVGCEHAYVEQQRAAPSGTGPYVCATCGYTGTPDEFRAARARRRT
jgi:hypothetical protein